MLIAWFGSGSESKGETGDGKWHSAQNRNQG